MKKIIENIGWIFLIGFVAIGLSYSIYETALKDEPVDILHHSLVLDCQREIARTELDKRFAGEAAEARRRSAETFYDQGRPIKAANEIATAKTYEAIANGYDRLTPDNCQDAYPHP